MQFTEDGVKRSVRNCYLYGLLLTLLVPFALVALLRTFYETEFPGFAVLAARTYNHFPLVKSVWWYSPYLSSSSPVASVLFIVLVAGAGAGLVMLRVGYARQLTLCAIAVFFGETLGSP